MKNILVNYSPLFSFINSGRINESGFVDAMKRQYTKVITTPFIIALDKNNYLRVSREERGLVPISFPKYAAKQRKADLIRMPNELQMKVA